MSAYELLQMLDAAGYSLMKILATVLWQSTILLSGLAMITYYLRKRSLSLRFALWLTALLLIPFLPLITSALQELGTPQKEIAVIPEYRMSIETTVMQAETPLPVHVPVTINTTPHQNIVSEQQIYTGLQPVDVVASGPAAVSRHSLIDSVLTFPWVFVLIAYSAGVMAFLCWIAVGRYRIRGWIDNGAAVMDERLVSLFYDAAERLGITREFIIMESRHVPAPLTCRTRRPVIIIPTGFAEDLTDDDLFSVALHELAHVKRHDVAALSLLSLVKALLFFHPLVWIAIRQASYLAELSCDSLVLEHTEDVTFYADMLTRIAEKLPRRAMTTELAAGFIFSKSAFFRRIEAIFAYRPDMFRRLSRFAAATVAVFCIVALGISLAVPLVVAGDSGPMETIAGTITHKGEPVSGATVWFNDQNARTLEKVTKSKRDGSFSFEIEKSRLSSDQKTLPSVVAWKKGYASGLMSFMAITDRKAVSIEFTDPVTFAGTVKNAEGNTISGAKVTFSGIGSLSKRPLNFTQFKGVSFPPLTAKSAKDGSFQIDAVPVGAAGIISVSADNYANTTAMQQVFNAEPVSITMKAGASITGRIVYDGTGKGAGGIRVLAKSSGLFMSGIYTTSKRDGSFSFAGLTSDSYSLIINNAGKDGTLAAEKVKGIVVGENDKITDIELRLVKGTVITGRVLDADSGAAIPNHFVSLNDPDVEPYVNRIDYTSTKADGSFTFHVAPGDYQVMTIPPEGYIHPDWYRQSNRVDDFRIPVDVSVAVNETVRVDKFRLPKGLVVTGTFKDSDGNPVGDVTYSYGEAFEGKTAVAASDGSFALTGLKKKEKLYLKAKNQVKQLRANREIEITADLDIDFELERYETTSISGRLVDTDGNPVTDGRVDLHWFGDGEDMTRGGTQDNMHSADDGYYTFDKLIVGDKYYIMAEAEGYKYDRRFHMEKMFDAAKDMPAHDDLVFVPMGKRWVEVTVKDQDGVPVVGAMVRSGGSAVRSQQTTDKKGFMRLEQFDTVVLREIMVDHEEYGLFMFRWMETNQHHDLKLVNGTHELSGIIVDADGTPLDSTSVSIEPSRHRSGKYLIRQETGPDGRFTFKNVIDGTVDLQVYSRSLGSKKFNAVAAAGDVKLVFDEPDPRPEQTWRFNPDAAVELEGKNAPELVCGDSITGSPFTLESMKGTVVVLDFLLPEDFSGDAYDPTYRKMRLIQALQKEYGDKGVVCISIHANTTDTTDIEKAIKLYNISYPIAMDSAGPEGSPGKTFDIYNISRHSTNVIIDRDGIAHPDIRASELESKLKEILGRKS